MFVLFLYFRARVLRIKIKACKFYDLFFIHDIEYE